MGAESIGYRVRFPPAEPRGALEMPSYIIDRKDATLTDFLGTMHPVNTWVATAGNHISDIGGIAQFCGVPVAFHARAGAIFSPVLLDDWTENVIEARRQRFKKTPPPQIIHMPRSKDINWIVDAPYGVNDVIPPPTARLLTGAEMDTALSLPFFTDLGVEQSRVPHPALESLMHQQGMTSVDSLRHALSSLPLLRAYYFLGIHEYADAIRSITQAP